MTLDDVIDRSVAQHDDVPLVYLGSGGHEMTIMRGLERQLSRKRIHTVFWEHANVHGVRPAVWGGAGGVCFVHSLTRWLIDSLVNWSIGSLAH